MAVPATLSSVPNVDPFIQYVATNGQTVYPYPFPITQDSDLVVVINGVTLGTDTGYSVSGVGNATGGDVTLSSGSTSGDIVTLYRDIPIERISQISQNSGFSSTVFNNEFNNFYLIAQQLEAAIEQCLQIPNTNNPAPVTTLTPASYAGMYLAFDSHGNPTPASLTSSGSLTGAIIAQLLNTVTSSAPTADKVRTAAEIAASVTPVNYQYAPGVIDRYGTNSIPGTTDMAAALQAAVNQSAQAGGAPVTGFATTYYIASTITLASNANLNLTGSTISAGSNQISLFQGSQINSINFVGGTLKYTASGTTTYVAGIKLLNCTYITIERVVFTQMQYDGVLNLSGSYVTVRGCRFTSFYGSSGSALQDAADIACISSTAGSGANQSPAGGACSYNVIDGNFCYGTNNQHGILLQDQYTNTAGDITTNTVVSNNRVGQHYGYGIIVYMPGVTSSNFDCRNQIIGNYVENIRSGTLLASPNTDQGAGIYVVGAACGGTQVIGNNVRNCCVDTSTENLAPAGIGINSVGGTSGSPSNAVPVVVANNTVSDMPNFHGILAVSCVGQVSIVGNTVRMPATNASGSHPGVPIYVHASSLTLVDGNQVYQLGTSSCRGIFTYADAVNLSNISIVNNIVNGGSFSQIEVNSSTSSFSTTGVVLAGNQLVGGSGTSCVPMKLNYIVGGTVTGNYLSAATTEAISVNVCTNLRFANNNFLTTGATAVLTAGACTGSVMDDTNVYTTSAGSLGGSGINNGGTGVFIGQWASSTPAGGSGTAIVGDWAINSAPTSTTAHLWRCTTAGNPGTWTALTLP